VEQTIVDIRLMIMGKHDIQLYKRTYMC
jgi:hypothetical protein